MKLSLNKLVSSIEAVKELATLKFKAKQAFQLSKLIKSAQSELETYEATRVATIKKYASDGQKVDEDKIPLFVQEITDLLAKQVDIYDCKVSLSDLEEFEISAGNLVLLDWLVQDDVVVGEIV